MNTQKWILPLVAAFVATSLSTSAFATNKFYTHNALLMPQLVKTTESGSDKATKLLYYGGPVISNVKVVTVFWNDNVSADVKAGIADFYSAYVNSTNMDWLNEFATNLKAIDGRDGTNQTIGRGTMIDQKVLAPSITSNKLQDTDIQAELKKQIAAGVLPKPDSNTLYMIHFPKKIQIVVDGMTSCLSFGGYHNGIKTTEYGDLFYGVMPECSMFGGGGFSDITYVSSHELIEAVTDPYPTPGSSPAYPQAWNTNDGSEIGDICNGSGTSFKGPSSDYNITLLWSNSRNKCYDGK